MAIRTFPCFNNFTHPIQSSDLLFCCKRGGRISSLPKLHTHCDLTTSFIQKQKRRSLRPGEVSTTRWVPDHIPRPSYISFGKNVAFDSKTEVHDEHGLGCMRASGNLAARVLQYAGTLVMPGVTTDDIDEAVHQMIINNGAYPSPLGYSGFPKSVCTSVNECICHGIPDSRALEDGDIINIDVTVYLNGYHGDTSATFLVGEVNAEAQHLVEVAKECVQQAVSICGPGVEYSKIGHVINCYADKYGLGVVEEFVGHGIGHSFHSEPIIMHCWNDLPGCMVLNQTFTIEPGLTAGSTEFVMWNDGWTVLTKDGSLSAQFEHTVLVTPDGAEILTRC